ncbi:MAG: patatin-like phospholipase family protein [Alphaproteobacteria bacterium]|nr:patatin-like phospholipase family protein [Alphaproteobacteria bacterium]
MTALEPAAAPEKGAGVKTVSLALQGGGAHGAFTWGVLDRLLDEPRLAVEALTATSAGAVNAVIFAEGLRTGGRPGAQAALAELWERIARSAVFSPLASTPFDSFLPAALRRMMPGRILLDIASRLISPYQSNPLNYNPLRILLSDMVDFAALRGHCPVQLFLSATNVRSGKIRVFTREELDVDHVLASGALPLMFQAVEIDGEAFWDGGFMGNPAIFPLIYNCAGTDVIIVHINPIERPDLPRTAPDILNRMNEITFNSSLMREMRAIEFAIRLIDEGRVVDNRLKRMKIHSIEADEVMRGLGVESKLHPDWGFLQELHAVGRETAEAWLAAHFDAIGTDSSVDIRARFL